MTIEVAIRWYLDRGGSRGLTATPGNRYYDRAATLDFQICRCSEADPEWTAREYIARTPRGAYLYVGTNRRNEISCGQKGYHSSQYDKGPPCI